MIFSLLHTGNLLTGGVSGFNAPLFALAGMGFVFAGLILVSLFIRLLPLALERPWRRSVPGGEAAGEEAGQGPDADVLTAIAVALHLDQDFPEERARITWKSHGEPESAWGVSGRIHLHATRGRAAWRVR